MVPNDIDALKAALAAEGVARLAAEARRPRRRARIATVSGAEAVIADLKRARMSWRPSKRRRLSAT
jgi:hypothetical protein